SNTSAIVGLRANQNPIRTPPTEPSTKASIDSTSVTHRCFQTVPCANILTTRAPTSAGLEKKNGGSSTRPKISTVLKTCQTAMATTPTSPCKRRSLMRDIDQAPPVVMRPSLRLGEASDQAGGALGVAVELLHQLVAGEAGLERLRIEVVRDQREGVVVPVAGRRARPEIMRELGRAGAADILVGFLADLALGEAC